MREHPSEQYITMAGNGNRFDPKRTFKAAVFAVGLINSMCPTEGARLEGKKSRPQSAAPSERATARRKIRAAVYAVLVANKRRRAVPEMDIRCESDYEEPVDQWEETVIPDRAAGDQFTEEVSLELEDLFASQEDYLRKISKLKCDRLWKKIIGQKLMARNQIRSVALAVFQTQQLNRALHVNMHPRNQYRGLEHVLSAAPKVLSEVKTLELYQRLHFRIRMRHKLRSSVYAVLAVQRLKKLRAAQRKMRTAVYAILAMIKLEDFFSGQGKAPGQGCHAAGEGPGRVPLPCDPLQGSSPRVGVLGQVPPSALLYRSCVVD